MLQHRRGLEPKTEGAERRLQARTSNLSAEPPQEQRRRACATGKVRSFETESIMTNEANRIDPEAWKYAEKTLTWHGWGSPVGLGLFIVAIGAFVALLHVAGVVG
jgi:hypothetical protein